MKDCCHSRESGNPREIKLDPRFRGGDKRFLPILNYHGIEVREGEYKISAAERAYFISKKEFRSQLEILRSEKFDTIGISGLEIASPDRPSGTGPTARYRPNELPTGAGQNGTAAPSGRSALVQTARKRESSIVDPPVKPGDDKNEVKQSTTLTRPVMITFDDGHVSNYEHAWPLLKEFGMPGAFFISTNFVGKPGYVDWDQIKELDAYGFDIGSHGVNHIPLTNLPDAELASELAGSKSSLEDRLGKAVESFSVPRGFYNARVRRAAESAGYRFVFTSRFGVNSQKIDFVALERLALRAGMDESEFKNWISDELGFKVFAEGMKDMLRSSLPPKLYDFAANLKRYIIPTQAGIQKNGLPLSRERQHIGSKS